MAKLLRFSATHNDDDAQTVSLTDYVGRMKDGQTAIYYITADGHAAARNSPHLEIFTKLGIEVLLLHERIDEWVSTSLHEFDGKPLQSAAGKDLDLSAIGGAAPTPDARTPPGEPALLLPRMPPPLTGRRTRARATHPPPHSPARRADRVRRPPTPPPPRHSAPAETTPAPAAPAQEPPKPTITFDDFKKVDLRVAKIVAAERVPKSEKLLKLQVEIGTERRQVVAGIAQHYAPETLVGKSVVVVYNLAPAKLMGQESQGMLLAASDASGALAVLSPSGDIASGGIVK